MQRNTHTLKKLFNSFKRGICLFIILTMITSNSYALIGGAMPLPAPTQALTLSPAFHPLMLQGLTINPQNPFNFNFTFDLAESGLSENDPQFEQQSMQMVKYFMAALTVPQEDLWVNLSPYESDRIVPDAFGQTEMGRDLLAQDYLLKQLTSSLMHPDSDIGRAFWDKIYEQAYQKYGVIDIPVDTFNKVWIMPNTAAVYQHGASVYVTDAKLKVMLEADYLATSHQPSAISHQQK